MRFSTKIVLSLLAIIPSSIAQYNGSSPCTKMGGYCHDATYRCNNWDEYHVTGYCPGPANIQCCVKAKSTACENYRYGKCVDTVFCNYAGGTIISGICPGPSNIKCCYWP